MNIGKALAVSAVAGMMMGTLGACATNAPAATDPSATEKKSCSGDKKSCTAAAGSAAPASSGDKKSCSGDKKSCSH